jgi:hypothetical protein
MPFAVGVTFSSPRRHAWRGVAACRWGYRLLVVEDLDGNQLFFNYPNEP